MKDLRLGAFHGLVILVPIPTRRVELFPIVDVGSRRFLENHEVDGRASSQTSSPSQKQDQCKKRAGAIPTMKTYRSQVRERPRDVCVVVLSLK